MGLFIISGLVIFIAIGTPIGITLGVISLIYLLIEKIPLEILIQQALQGSNKFVLVAIPFFLLTGELMKEGEISNKLINFANSFVGHIRGGLAHVNIVVSMLFAGISGSALADTSAIGSVLIPEMVEKGYDRDFSTAVTGISSIVGPIIPPSMPMIIAAYLARQSVGKMFLGGAIPGILFGLGMMAVVLMLSKKYNFPLEGKFTIKNFFHTFIEAILPLLTPAIILGGIMFGIFTASQAGAIAATYSFILGVFIYKHINLSKFLNVIKNTATKTASVMFVVALANVYTWMIVNERIPQYLLRHLFLITDNSYILLGLIVLSLLLIGCILSTTPAIILSIPVLVPIASTIGFDPLYFSVLATIILCIGTITPPVGLTLYLVSSIGKVEVEKVLSKLIPFYLIVIIVVILLIIFPGLITWLPGLM
jgi:C4-dicarboxylate transporter, DctM subunit